MAAESEALEAAHSNELRLHGGSGVIAPQRLGASRWHRTSGADRIPEMVHDHFSRGRSTGCCCGHGQPSFIKSL